MDLIRKPAMFFLGLVLVVAFFTHTYALNLDLNIAARGFSILEVLQARENDAGFLRDYPGGARLTTATSPTVYLYFLGDSIGFSWMGMVYAMIFLEMCVLLVGARLLWAALLPETVLTTSREMAVTDLMFVWVSALLLTSCMQRANLANFGFPFFHGQFYGFADGARLAVLAMILRQRWVAGAAYFVICFAIHPIKAAVIAVFCLPCVLRNWRSLGSSQFIVAAIVSVAGTVLWTFVVLKGHGSEASVPFDDFIAYTRTFQVHWYPLDMGVFSDRHLKGATPFLALTVVMLLALAQSGWSADTRRNLQLGLVVAVVVSAAGVYVSANPQSATLVRISLVRASNAITLLAPIVIVVGSFLAWRERNWLLTAGFFAFVTTSFTVELGEATLPAVFAVFLVYLHFRGTRQIGILLATATALLLLCIAYFAAVETGLKSSLIGMLPALLIFGFVYFLLRSLHLRQTPVLGGNLAIYILTVAMIGGGLVFGLDRYDRFSKRPDEFSAYKETQVWANRNTSATALFMVDPCRWYGWRDFSGRASIGTVREWYMTAWLYTDDGEMLARGDAIANDLGFDVQPFRNTPRSNKQICDAARTAYYDLSFQGHSRVADRHDVNYFVFEKQYLNELPSTLEDLADYQNEYFMVLSAERLRNWQTKTSR